MKPLSVLSGLVILAGVAAAQNTGPQEFDPARIKAGADLYARNCAPCHGPRMMSPEAFDLKTFPPNEPERFVNSVTNGKNQMPPWRGLLSREDIAALWAYVVAGEKR